MTELIPTKEQYDNANMILQDVVKRTAEVANQLASLYEIRAEAQKIIRMYDTFYNIIARPTAWNPEQDKLLLGSLKNK